LISSLFALQKSHCPFTFTYFFGVYAFHSPYVQFSPALVGGRMGTNDGPDQIHDPDPTGDFFSRFTAERSFHGIVKCRRISGRLVSDVPMRPPPSLLEFRAIFVKIHVGDFSFNVPVLTGGVAWVHDEWKGGCHDPVGHVAWMANVLKQRDEWDLPVFAQLISCTGLPIAIDP